VNASVAITGGTPVGIRWSSSGTPSGVPSLSTDTTFSYISDGLVRFPAVEVDFGGGNIIKDEVTIYPVPGEIYIDPDLGIRIPEYCRAQKSGLELTGEIVAYAIGDPSLESQNYLATLTGPNGLSLVDSGNVRVSISGGEFFMILFQPPNGQTYPPGQYTLDLEIFLNDDCPTSISHPFVVPEPFDLQITNITKPVCGVGGSVELLMKNGRPPYRVEYSVEGINNKIFTSDSSITLSNLSSGEVRIAVIEWEEFISCTQFIDTLLVDSVLNVEGTTSSTQCISGGGIDLTVTSTNGPVSYLWSTGDTTEDLSNLSPGTYSVSVTDLTGCTVQDSFVVDTTGSCPTSNDISLRSLIHIFPNPTTNILQVESENLHIQQIQLFDLRGRMLMGKREQTDILNLYDLSQGIYILEVQTDQGILTEKIIKQ